MKSVSWFHSHCTYIYGYGYVNVCVCVCVLYILCDTLKWGVFLLANGLLNCSCIDYHAFYEFNTSKSWNQWTRKKVHCVYGKYQIEIIIAIEILSWNNSKILKWTKWMEREREKVNTNWSNTEAYIHSKIVLFASLLCHSHTTATTIDWLSKLLLKSFQVVLPNTLFFILQ